MTMKENQNGTSFDSRSFGNETDALTFGSKEGYELNSSKMDANLTELETKDSNGYTKFKVKDDCCIDDENGTTDSPGKEGQNGVSRDLIMDSGIEDFPRMECKDGLSNLSNWDKDADSISTDSYDMEKEQGSPECESFDTVEDLADCNARSDAKDLHSPLFTDKTVLECDVPEFEVCYREDDCHVLKDICIDEGSHEKDVNVIESGFSPLPPQEDPLLDVDSFIAQPCGSKEENGGIKLISQADKLDSCKEENNGIKLICQAEKLDSSLRNLFERDTIKHCEPENTVDTSEACFNDTVSSEDSLVDRKLSIEDSGDQNLHGLDEGEKVMQLSEQVPDQEAVHETPTASSAEAEETGKDVHPGCLAYNSNVENEIITFNFSSPEGVAASNGTGEDIEVKSTENPPAATSKGEDDSHKQSLLSSEENSTTTTTTTTGEGSSCGNAAEASSEHKPANSDEVPVDDAHSSEPNAPVINPILQQDMGETSFSAASLINYSGPIAFSGSLSHRSDGSTTSGKSFAFPVLQSEWNSSPVRMAKADRRDFRKHKGWRSGLLCCRF